MQAGHAHLLTISDCDTTFREDPARRAVAARAKASRIGKRCIGNRQKSGQSPETCRLCHGSPMNNRQRKTLEAIFGEPTPADLEWSELASLLSALGAERSEGSGSRVRFKLGDAKLVIHRPHPKPVMDRNAVRAVRAFLIARGIQP
ncbi:MAG: type II toxin-antitoxin system HicA family toxin [Neomegalonema sp.]|nr:type II toxin-antitoxin system HicA family toxin [Neomegalonema sp.]